MDDAYITIFIQVEPPNSISNYYAVNSYEGKVTYNVNFPAA